MGDGPQGVVILRIIAVPLYCGLNRSRRRLPEIPITNSSFSRLISAENQAKQQTNLNGKSGQEFITKVASSRFPPNDSKSFSASNRRQVQIQITSSCPLFQFKFVCCLA